MDYKVIIYIYVDYIIVTINLDGLLHDNRDCTSCTDGLDLEVVMDYIYTICIYTNPMISYEHLI